jgi:hypothetical protein
MPEIPPPRKEGIRHDISTDSPDYLSGVLMGSLGVYPCECGECNWAELLKNIHKHDDHRGGPSSS